MKNLPNKNGKIPSNWVQIPRATLVEWGGLIIRIPTTARLLMLLASRIRDHNAVVASQPTLAALLNIHVNTVAKATKMLADERWLEVRRVSGSGSTNAYVLNDRVV